MPVTRHGELTQVLDNVFIVRGTFPMSWGVLIERTMTIVRRGDQLTIFNAVRVNESVESEIQKLGSIRHLVRMAIGHGFDDSYYLDTFHPTYWTVEGMEPYPGTNPSDHQVFTEKHDGNNTTLPIPEMKFVILKTRRGPELVSWIPDGGGTVLTCDFLQNTITPEYANWCGKRVTYWFGFQGECKCVPVWRHVFGTDGLWEDIERGVLNWEFENLISGHGEAKLGNARSIVEKNLKEVFKKD